MFNGSLSVWIFMSISAVLYVLACVYSDACAWMMFLFFLPLCSIVQSGAHLTAWYGFGWGLIVFFGVGFGLLVLLYEGSAGFLCIMPCISIILVCVAWCALWFFVASRLLRNVSLTARNHEVIRGTLWCSCAFLFLSVMHDYSYWPLCTTLYNPFSYPLIPLMTYTWCVHLVSLWGPHAVLCGILVGNYIIAIILARYSGAAFVLTIIIVISVIIMCRQRVPISFSHSLWYGTIKHTLSVTAYDCMEQLYQQLQQHDIYNATLIVLPESSLPYQLNKIPRLLRFCADYVSPGTLLLFGAQREEEGWIYNTIYMIRQGNIVGWYDKRLLLPGAEYTPQLLQTIPWLSTIFMAERPEFSAGIHPSPIVECGDLTIIPFICSEFFFVRQRELHWPQHALLVCIAHDGWFSCAYLRKLMVLTARFKAALLRMSVIYVSYNFGKFFDPDGTEYCLSSF